LTSTTFNNLFGGHEALTLTAAGAFPTRELQYYAATQGVEAAVIRHFRERMPYGLLVPDVREECLPRPRVAEAELSVLPCPPSEEGFPGPRPWHSPRDMLGRQERMVSEYRALLAKAGFRPTRVIPTGSPFHALEAVAVC
jgi:hypothetical protein